IIRACDASPAPRPPAAVMFGTITSIRLQVCHSDAHVYGLGARIRANTSSALRFLRSLAAGARPPRAYARKRVDEAAVHALVRAGALTRCWRRSAPRG